MAETLTVGFTVGGYAYESDFEGPAGTTARRALQLVAAKPSNWDHITIQFDPTQDAALISFYTIGDTAFTLFVPERLRLEMKDFLELYQDLHILFSFDPEGGMPQALKTLSFSTIGGNINPEFALKLIKESQRKMTI